MDSETSSKWLDCSMCAVLSWYYLNKNAYMEFSRNDISFRLDNNNIHWRWSKILLVLKFLRFSRSIRKKAFEINSFFFILKPFRYSKQKVIRKKKILFCLKKLCCFVWLVKNINQVISDQTYDTQLFKLFFVQYTKLRLVHDREK